MSSIMEAGGLCHADDADTIIERQSLQGENTLGMNVRMHGKNL